ncbi:hypothetical protein [Arenimonas terrae]|uniref:DUF2007 domain-containing protein n=1 Tax=Arenimonas terrae TaxID=2546226 RepID=A0A5C4RXE6_9GAMM|nr:hypothetical protein [Arenimonas terrae]TNJ35790.1 hypothetical protein E1B00_08610 [Arenimonas terrae]
MKLLGVYSSAEESSAICGLLRKKGIPTYGEISAPSWRLNRIPIYVCLDSQYEDALAVLANPNHLVANPVDVAEYDSVAERQEHHTLLRWSVVALLLAAAFFAVVLYLADAPLLRAPPN